MSKFRDPKRKPSFSSLAHEFKGHDLCIETLERRYLLAIDTVNAIDIGNGLTQFSRYLTRISDSGVYAQQLPGTAANLGSITNNDADLPQIEKAIDAYFSKDVTISDDDFEEVIRRGVSNISTATRAVDEVFVDVNSTATGEILLHLSFRIRSSVNLELSLGPEFGPLTYLSTTTPVPVRGTNDTIFDLTIGINLQADLPPSEAFFVRDSSITHEITLTEAGVNFPAIFGILEVDVSGFSLLNHAVIETSIKTLAGAGKFEIRQVDFLAESALQYVFTDAKNLFDSSMEVRASIGNWATSGIPFIAFRAENSFAGQPSITKSNDFGQIEGFANRSSSELVSLIRHLETITVDVISKVKPSENAPFLAETNLAELLDNQKLISDSLNSLDVAATPSSIHFQSLQALRRKLVEVFPDVVADELLIYDPITNEVKIGLDLSGSVPDLVAPVFLPNELIGLSSIGVSGDIQLSRQLRTSLTLGLSLGSVPSDQFVDRVFVDNLIVEGSVLYQGENLALTALSGAIDLAATGRVSGEIVNEVRLRRPNGQRRFAATELYSALRDGEDVIDVDRLTSSATLEFSDFRSGGGIFARLVESAELSVKSDQWPTTSQLTVLPSGALSQLISYRAIPVGVVYDALREMHGLLNEVGSATILGVRIASLSGTIDDVSKFADRFGQLVESFRIDPPSTFAEIGNKLLVAMDAASLARGSVTVSFGQDGVLQVEFTSTYDVNRTMPLNIELEALGIGLPSLVSVKTNDIAAAGKLTFQIKTGIDFRDPQSPQPVVYDTTQIRFEGTLKALNFDAEFQFGPLTLKTQGATLIVDGDGNLATDDKFIAIATFVPSTAGYRPISSVRLNDFRSSTAGKADLLLPLRLSSVELGTLSFLMSDLSNPLSSTNFRAAYEFLFSAFDSSDLDDAFDSIIIGLEEFFTTLDESISGFAFRKIPLLGSLDEAAGKLFENLRERIEREYQSLLERTPEALKNVLFKAIGPGGIDVLRDFNSDGQVTNADIVLNKTPEDIHYGMLLGASPVLARWEGDADLDLPGLDFKVQGNVLIELPWQLRLGFGISDAVGFYIDTALQNELSVQLKMTIADASLEGKIGFLRLRAKDNQQTPSVLQVNALIDFRDTDNDGRWTFNELPGLSRLFDGAINVGLSGSADLVLDVIADFGTDQAPSISTKLKVYWSFSNVSPSSPWSSFGEVPSVEFSNTRIDVGRWIKEVLGPHLDFAREEVLDRIRPVLKFLQSEVPVIDVTVMELIGLNDSVQSLVRFLSDLDEVITTIDELVDNGVMLQAGQFTIIRGDVREPKSSSQKIEAVSTGNQPMPWRQQIPSGSLRSTIEKSVTIGEGSIRLPFLEQPISIMNLLLGGELDLVRLRLPTVLASTSAAIYGYVGPLLVGVSGSVQLEFGAEIGFDTRGLRTGVFVDGLYVVQSATYAKVDAEIAIFGGVGVEIAFGFSEARAGLEGALAGTVSFRLFDPNQDGKLRYSELRQFGGSLEIVGSVHFLVRAVLEVEAFWGAVSFSERVTLFDKPLLEFGSRPSVVFEEPGPVFTVTNSLDDDSRGTLRYALRKANSYQGVATIQFNIPTRDPSFIDTDSFLPGGDPTQDAFRIQLHSPLPPLTNPFGIRILGSTQQVLSGDTNAFGPEIILSGEFAGDTDGIRVRSNKNLIEGIVIHAFRGNGIRIENGSENELSDLYIGTGASGRVGISNTGSGVVIQSGSRNNRLLGSVISGNFAHGVVIAGIGTDSNLILNNLIGTSSDGQFSLSNGNSASVASGVLIRDGAKKNIIGGRRLSESNIISGNTGSGVEIAGLGTDENQVVGNIIGQARGRFLALSNLQAGVMIRDGAGRNVVGGSGREANTISGNLQSGVQIQNGANSNSVISNRIGLDHNGSVGLGNNQYGVRILNSGQNTISHNAVSGNLVGGFLIEGSATERNLILGNFIGTSTNGMWSLSNGGEGIEIRAGASRNSVGGVNWADRNVISGNAGSGILVSGSVTVGNQIRGNIIGLNTTGNAGLNNVRHGIEIDRGVNTGIGSTEVGSGNLISGNAGAGIWIVGGVGTTIVNNTVGLDLRRERSLANQGDGVSLRDGSSSSSVHTNILSGNVGSGIVLTGQGTRSNVVFDNLIGTGRFGSNSIGNSGGGVRIVSGATDNTIGGRTTDGNTISGNLLFGIEIAGEGTNRNQVQGNTVGLSQSNSFGLNNAGPGILIRASANSTLVGGDLGFANVIGGNSASGVLITDATVLNTRVIGNDIGRIGNGSQALGNARFGVEFRLPNLSHLNDSIKAFISDTKISNLVFGGVQLVYADDTPPTYEYGGEFPIRILVPAYFGPVPFTLSEWYDMANGNLPGVSEVFAVANIGSGVGLEGLGGPFIPANYDANITRAFYADAFRYSSSRGVKIFGYVSTQRGTRPIENVLADINQWATFGGSIKGVFLDEQAVGQPSDPNGALDKLPYYQQLRQRVMQVFGQTNDPVGDPRVISNPGNAGDTPDDIEEYIAVAGSRAVSVADFIVIFEGTTENDYAPPSWTQKYAEGRFASIVHSTTSLQSALEHISFRRSGVLYVTDDGIDGNPWDELSNFWPEFTNWVRFQNRNQVKVVPIEDQIATVGNQFRLLLPESTFSSVDFGGSATLSASRSDGLPLPSWLSFESKSGMFSGTPTQSDIISFPSVRLTAKGVNGLIVRDVFEVRVEDPSQPLIVAANQSNIAGDVLSVLTNSGIWRDQSRENVSLGASLGTINKNSNGTWDWSYLPLTWLVDQVVTITARDSANISSTTFTVNAFPKIQVNVDLRTFGEDGGTTIATVSRNTSKSEPLTVNISSDITSRLIFPASVTIPSGAASTSFIVRTVDNAIAEGTQEITIQASSSGIVSGAVKVTVTDDDIAKLTLSVAPASIPENGGKATGTVTRNTPIGSTVDINLASSNSSEVSLPASVVIPAGQSSVTFSIASIDNLIIEGNKLLAVSASSIGLVSATSSLTILDDDISSIGITISPSSIPENGGRAIGTITRNFSAVSALTVNLSSSNSTAVTFPSSVVIPSEQSFVTFAIVSLDDLLVDGNKVITVTATSSGFSEVTGTVTTLDDDVPSLGLVVAPLSISENSGRATVIVTRNTPKGTALTVNLANDFPSALTVPASVVIPSGQSSATFSVFSVDDQIAYGNTLITITASSIGLASDSIPVTILDDEVPTFGLTISPASISEKGGKATARLTRNTPTTQSLLVRLASDDVGEATVPEFVTIPMGASSVEFTITAVQDFLVDGDQSVSITADAIWFSMGLASVTIVDVDTWTWTNPVNPLDTDDDRTVSPLDVLIVINYINKGGAGKLSAPLAKPEYFPDVDSDGFISPLDVLSIINYLNRATSGGEGEKELVAVSSKDQQKCSFFSLDLFYSTFDEADFARRKKRW
jgi:hypothetical protein